MKKIITLFLILFTNSLVNSELKKPKYVFPLKNKYYITQYKNKTHSGIDLISNKSRLVYSVEDCIVSEVIHSDPIYKRQTENTPKGRAWTPRLICKGEFVNYVYAHITTTHIVGNRLIAGQIIGHYNDHGNATGAHLHFEVWDKQQNYLDPIFVKDFKDPDTIIF